MLSLVPGAPYANYDMSVRHCRMVSHHEDRVEETNGRDSGVLRCGFWLFAACDPIGGNYLGEAIDTVGDHDRYAVVGVQSRPHGGFSSRPKYDLRTVMLEAPGVRMVHRQYAEGAD